MLHRPMWDQTMSGIDAAETGLPAGVGLLASLRPLGWRLTAWSPDSFRSRSA